MLLIGTVPALACLTELSLGALEAKTVYYPPKLLAQTPTRLSKKNWIPL